MPAAVVDAWETALESMRTDGSFGIILKKYYPGGELPGPAKTEF